MAKQQLDELSKKKLNQYSDKATTDLSSSWQMPPRKFKNRVKGTTQAAKRLNAETELNELDSLIQNLVDEKPSEFAQTFDSLLKDRIGDLVANRKLELSQAVFGAPEGQEEE